jgi:hypothetical protein
MNSLVLYGFNQRDIVRNLKKFGSDGYLMIIVVNFVFDLISKSFFNELNNEFSSKLGRPAYPRKLLFMIVLYGYMGHKSSTKELSKECHLNDIYKVICCGKTP